MLAISDSRAHKAPCRLTQFPLRALSAFVFSLVGCASPIFSQEPIPSFPPPPPIHVTVSEVNIGVTVIGKNGIPVAALRRDDFRVFDNGAPQTIVGFLSDNDPGLVVLLLEAGPGAFFNQASELRAAGMFLDALPPNYRVALVSYSRNPTLLVDFTNDKTNVRQGLATMNFKAGYAELNLIASISSTIDWLTSLAGKKSIVLLSSGIDTSPQLDWPAVQQKLDLSDVRIIAVSVSQEIRKPAKDRVLSPEQRRNLNFAKTSFDDADRGLRQLAEPTGGHVYFPKQGKDFDRAFSEIAKSLSHEYRLSISPTSPDGQFHTLSVKVDRLFSNISFRRGYFVPPPPTN